MLVQSPFLRPLVDLAIQNRPWCILGVISTRDQQIQTQRGDTITELPPWQPHVMTEHEAGH